MPLTYYGLCDCFINTIVSTMANWKTDQLFAPLIQPFTPWDSTYCLLLHALCSRLYRVLLALGCTTTCISGVRDKKRYLIKTEIMRKSTFFPTGIVHSMSPSSATKPDQEDRNHMNEDNYADEDGAKKTCMIIVGLAKHFYAPIH